VLFSLVFAAAQPRRSLDSFSRPTHAYRLTLVLSVADRRFRSCGKGSPKSHEIILFTDPHPLTLLESYRFKNMSGQGRLWSFNIQPSNQSSTAAVELRSRPAPTMSERLNVCFRPIPLPFTFLRTLWHGEKLNSFIFKQFRTLYPKTPGGGGTHQLGSMWPRAVASKVE